MTKEEVVKEQMRKLDHSHTSVEKALGDAFDAGAGRSGDDVQPEAEKEESPKSSKRKPKSQD
jgi:hypothetical protein